MYVIVHKANGEESGRMCQAFSGNLVHNKVQNKVQNNLPAYLDCYRLLTAEMRVK